MIDENIGKIFKDLRHYLPAKILPGVLNFFVIIIFTRILNPDDYGAYILVTSTVSLVSTLLFSWLSQSNLRLYEKYKGLNRTPEYITTNFILFFLIIIPSALLWYLSAVVFHSSFRGRIYPMLQIGTIYLFFEGAFSFSTGFLRAERNSRIYMKQNLIKSLGSPVLAIMFICFFSLKAESILITSSLFSAVFFTQSVLRLKSQWKIRSAVFSREIALNSFSYGIPLSLAGLGTLALSVSDRYFIEYFQGSSSVGIYSAGYRISEMSILLLSGVLMFGAFPVIISTYESKGAGKTRELLNQLSSVYIISMLPVAVSMSLFSYEIVHVLLGEKYAGCHVIIPWVSSGAFLSGLIQIINKPYELKEKTGLLLYFLVGSAAANILLNFYFVPHFGFLGAAVSTVLGYIFYLVLSWSFLKKAFTYPFPAETLIKSSAASFCMLLFNFLVLRHLTVSIFGLGVKLLSSGAVYLAVLFLLKESTWLTFYRSFLSIKSRRNLKAGLTE